MCLFLSQDENKQKPEQKPPLKITGMKDGQEETLFTVLGNAVVMSTSCHWHRVMNGKPAALDWPSPYGKRRQPEDSCI